MASLFPKVSSPFPVSCWRMLLFSPIPPFLPPSFVHSDQRWMRSTAPSACWPPVPPGCRWSVVRLPRRSPGPPRWITSSSLSRSSSAPTILPRLPSSWLPSPLGRKNSDGREERGSKDRWVQGWTRTPLTGRKLGKKTYSIVGKNMEEESWGEANGRKERHGRSKVTQQTGKMSKDSIWDFNPLPSS